MQHALKEKIKCSLVKLPSYTTNSLCKCGTISIEGLKMSVDEIDTILLLRTKANFVANYIQINRDKQG